MGQQPNRGVASAEDMYRVDISTIGPTLQNSRVLDLRSERLDYSIVLESATWVMAEAEYEYGKAAELPNQANHIYRN